MDKTVLKVTYRDSLDKGVRDRYDEKLSLIGGQCPYEISNDTFSNDVECLPELTYIDILNYLVNSKSAYTLEQLKSYKSLEAYNQFVCGWVRDVSSVITNGRVLVTARVRHSQRMNDTPLKPWLVVDKSGIVEAAHCNCQAGLGEACTHVGALLFYIEAASRLRSSKTVTQEKAYWLLPSSINKVPYSFIHDIDFTSAETKKRKLDTTIDGYSEPKRMPLKLPTVPELSEEEFHNSKETLTDINSDMSKPVVLAVSRKHQKSFIPKILQEGQLPKPFISFKDEKFAAMTEDELKNECIAIFSALNVTKEQAQNAEIITRGQSTCKEWHTMRMGRITASVMKSVCVSSLDKPSISTVKNICGQSKFSNKATAWGCNHEKDAVREYTKMMEHTHENFKVIDCGLFINPKYPHIGASPDGVVSCDCCGEGVLEVKCPYCARNELLCDARVDCLHEGKLKETHKYSYQVQTQMLVTEKTFCDFIIWTEKDLSVQRITPNFDIHSEIVQKSRTYFLKVILPEITGSLITRERQNALKQSYYMNVPQAVPSQNHTGKSGPEIICICQKPYDEEKDNVVGCDGENCPYKWWHLSCAKIKKVPKRAYYCPKCRKNRKKICTA